MLPFDKMLHSKLPPVLYDLHNAANVQLELPNNIYELLSVIKRITLP